MYESRNPNFGDSDSWLSDAAASSAAPHRPSAAGANLDRVLFNDLVEMVPLVESLILNSVQDRKPNTSFTRRGSMVYTKTPSRESLSKKSYDPKGRNAAQSIPAKKKKEHGDKDQTKAENNKSQDSDSFSMFSSRALISEKEIEELGKLRDQVEDLQKKLSEKDDLLKSAENSVTQMNAIHEKFDELKRLAAEKDSLLKSTQLQLSDAKIKLADKQAALEKLQWEAMTFNQKAEKLQEELDSVQGDFLSLMQFFEGLTKNDSFKQVENYDIRPAYFDFLPEIDDLDDMEMEKMEQARDAYTAAVAALKEKQDEESIAAAARARQHLESFVFKSSNMYGGQDFPFGGF